MTNSTHSKLLRSTFPSLIAPVENMQIAVHEGLTHRAYDTRIFGWIPPVSLMVEHPQTGGRLAPMEVGKEIKVRMLVSTHVYSFTSIILGICKYPHPYLHLRHPRSFQTTQVRRNRRFPLPKGLPVIIHSGKHSIPGVLVDLSMGGAGIATMHAVNWKDAHARLKLALPLDGRSEEMTLECRVQRFEEDGGKPGFKMGLEFVLLNHQEQIVLERYLFSISQACPTTR